MKKAHPFFIFISLGLLLVSTLLHQTYNYMHWDLPLDVFIPITLILLFCFQLFVSSKGNFPPSKSQENLALVALIFSSLYHLGKHTLHWDNAPLLIGECTIMAIILIIELDENVKLASKRSLSLLSLIPLTIAGDFLVSTYTLDHVTGVYVQMAQLALFLIVLWLATRNITNVGTSRPVPLCYAIILLLSGSVFIAMFSQRLAAPLWPTIEIYLKWLAYLCLIDLIVSALPSVLDRTLHLHKHQLFMPFKFSSFAHVLVEWVDDKWSILEANDAAISMLNLNPHQLNQLSIENFFASPDFLAPIEGSAPTRLFNDIQVINAGQKPFFADVQTQTIISDYGHLMIIDIRDITQRREILKKIALREAVFTNASEAILITDVYQNIIDVNPAFVSFYGFDRDALIGQKPSLIKSGLIGSDFYKTMWQKVNSEGSYSDEFINRKENGSLITVFQSIIRIKMTDEETYYVSVASDITQKKATESLIFNLAFRDAVTQIFNKTYLLQLEHPPEYHVAILFTLRDIKLLKSYYDDSFIDSLMSTLVRKLESTLIEGSLYKWSEDQILVFLTYKNFYEFNEGLIITKLHEQLKENLYIQQKSIHPMISAAWTMKTQNALITDLTHLEAATTYSLSKKNHCVQYNADLEKDFDRTRQIEILLSEAIVNKELFVLYQPIIDIKTSTVKGCEALVRWQSPELGIVRPDEFIGIAERTHMIMDLGFFVADEAMKVLASLLPKYPQFVMAFNVSIVQLMDPHFSTQISHMAAKHNIEPSSLTIEITESQYLGVLDLVQNNLNNFKSAGFQLSVDDFGTGYSSLSRIKDLQAHYIKIDKVFFDDIESSIGATLLTNGILAFAEQMGFNVIAEGIETVEQIIYLKNKNIRFVQGYAFSYPISEIQLHEFLEKPFSLESYLMDEFDDDYKLIQKLDSRISTDVLKRQNISSIILDTALNITSCSKTFMENVAYESHEILGNPLTKFLSTQSELLMDLQELETHPTHQSNHFTQLCTALGREISVYMACRLNYTEGGLPGSVTCIIENLTDQNFDIQSYMMEQESYSRFFEKAPLPSIVWNEDLSIQVANTEAMKLFQSDYTSPHLLKIETLLGGNQSKEFHYHYNRVFAGYSQDSWIDVKDFEGKIRDMHWYSTPLMDQTLRVTQVLTILEDRTELNTQTENAKLLRDAANLSDRIVIFTNDEHDILFVNKIGYETFGITTDDGVLANLKSLPMTFIDSRNTLMSLDDLGDQLWTGVIRIMMADGTITLYDGTRDTAQFSNSRMQKAYLYSLHNKTEDLKSSIEVDQLRKSLSEQERLASIGKLIAGVAHEINNPLSYMIGNADYLRKIQPRIMAAFNDDTDFSEDLQDVFQSFNDGLNVIKNIVADLKIYSRKSVSDDKEYCQINDLIQLTLRIAHNEIKYSSLMQLELGDELPDLYINAPKIQQVLLNLIINANHAITSRWENDMGLITITTSATEDHVLCSICDNGTGMDEATMGHIFEAFYTTKEVGIGTGLGLSVSKDIIETLHKGELNVSSTLGEGTCFTLKLPLMVNDQAPEEDL